MITHCLFSTKSTFVCTDNNKITTLSSFEYVTIWTPDDDGTDGIWSSIPPTTCTLTKNQYDLLWNWKWTFNFKPKP